MFLDSHVRDRRPEDQGNRTSRTLRTFKMLRPGTVRSRPGRVAIRRPRIGEASGHPEYARFSSDASVWKFAHPDCEADDVKVSS